MTDQSAGWEQMQADLEMQQMILEALDAAAEGKASEEQIRLLAWHAGVTWKPNERTA